LCSPAPGVASSCIDKAYEEAGATIAATAADTLRDADFVFKVIAPTADEVALLKQGATVLAAFAPHANPNLDAYAARGLTCVAMELIPRITRAQNSDILSSQANAGRLQGRAAGRQRIPAHVPDADDRGRYREACARR
jgi:NAD(P) transhydrogenase subunit alpha